MTAEGYPRHKERRYKHMMACYYRNIYKKIGYNRKTLCYNTG
jgi:hypothetical protein